ncbi:MAG: hypothetical protein PHE25_00900 [Candidatus Gracilibacteria bacterium]|nr:hypothetical protein [Candidatus Gracilibacteria bacterium]
MVTTNDYKTDKNVNRVMYISIILFAVVLFSTIGLYFYNSNLKIEIEKVNKDITKLDADIKEINNDEKVKLYKLITLNKTYLEKYNNLSKIPEFINNLNKLSIKYNISFENFSYSNSKITTNVIALDDGINFGYEKTKKFISSFRDNSSNDIFNLSFVNYFGGGQEQIKFNAQFEIK